MIIIIFLFIIPQPPTPTLHAPWAKACSSPHDPLSTHGRSEGWDRKGMLKSAPSALRNLHFPRPQAGARRECRSEETHPPEEEGRAGPGGWGMHRAPSLGRGVSGRPAPRLPWWEEKGWSRTGATTSNAPEYQGTAVRAFSSAPQRCPGQALALHVRLHALLESLAVVRVLGGVGESRGSGV